MSRPTEPQKKEELLERCLDAAIEVGALDSSLNAIAKRIGTSGRMLVYHFGSKQELERQIIGKLETHLREKLESIQRSALQTAKSPTEPLVEMWEHLTAAEMHSLLQLTIELIQRAIQGDLETQLFVERESQKWIDSLFNFTKDRAIALTLFYLFQGALLDYLATGNSQRGREAIATFTKARL